jgi:hypothetical protein
VQLNSKLDLRKINIEEKNMEAVLNTGVTDNIISSNVLKKLKNPVINPEEKCYELFVGTKGKTIGSTIINYRYNNKNYTCKFNIIRNEKKTQNTIITLKYRD